MKSQPFIFAILAAVLAGCHNEPTISKSSVTAGAQDQQTSADDEDEVGAGENDMSGVDGVIVARETIGNNLSIVKSKPSARPSETSGIR